MRLFIFSDLHLEYAPLPRSFCVPKADVCVAAGDINTHGGEKSLRWLADTVAPHMPVVFVPGNHEFYKAALLPSLDRMLALSKELRNVHFLHDSSVTLDGVLFAGATLWTDFNVNGEAELATYYAADRNRGMNDYKRIKLQSDPWRRFTPFVSVGIHKQSKAFLDKTMRESDAATKVVVTHHAPSSQSLDAATARETLSAAYASNMDDFVRACGAKLWIHGHVHRPNDYKIGDTRIISNPRGYGDNESGTSFNPSLVLEV